MVLYAWKGVFKVAKNKSYDEEFKKMIVELYESHTTTAANIVREKVDKLEPLVEKVDKLESLVEKVNKLEPLVERVDRLEPLVGKVDILINKVDNIGGALFNMLLNKIIMKKYNLFQKIES